MAAVVAIALYVAVATFTPWFPPVAPGLDLSWIYAINQIPHTEFRFGQDIVFTWGPLGYLIVPMNLGSNVVQSATLWVVTQIVIVAAIVYRYLIGRRIVPVVVFSLGYLITLAFGMSFDYRLLIVLGLLLTFTPREGPAWRVASPAAGFLAGGLVFTKFSIGLSAVLMVAVAGTMWAIGREAKLRDVAFILWLPLLVTLVAVGTLLMGGIGGLAKWSLTSFDMGSGYAVAMSGEVATPLLLLAFFGLAIYALIVIVMWRIDPPTGAIGFAFLGPAYFALRHSFIRHGGRFILPLLVGAAALLVLRAQSRRALMVGCVGLGLLLIPAGLISGREECACPFSASTLSPASGWSGLKRLIDLSAHRRELDRSAKNLLREAELPQEWIQAIGGRLVGVVPYELSFIPANGLRWVPNPTIQTYAVLTRRLDTLTAEHFSNQQAPDFLIVHYGDIDYRHSLWGAPQMWRAILSHYEPIKSELDDELLLFERRLAPTEFRLNSSFQQKVPIGSWQNVPSNREPLFARIRFEASLVGDLKILLWQVPPIQVDVRYEDGAVFTYRLLPTTSGQGLLMTPLPRDTEEFLKWIRGGRVGAVKEFRIRGSGTSDYIDPVDVEWATGSWISVGIESN